MKTKRLFMAIVAIFLTTMVMQASVTSGSCGDGVTYILDTENKLLKIKGSGDMEDYELKTTINQYPTTKYINSPWYNADIEKVEIEEGVTRIGNYAFAWTRSIKTVNIPESVTSIGYNAFAKCSQIKSITIPNSVTSIGDHAFSYCSLLSSINIPNSLTTIASYAFYKCSSLTSITIPKTVTDIGYAAFQDCNRLSSIFIPNSVTSIGDCAFSGCTSLPVIDNIRYADTYLVSVTDRTLSAFRIKENTRFIGSDAFSTCIELGSIHIPNSVTSIGGDAFNNCSGLTSVTIPNSVTSIGDRAFSDCSGLTSVTIPNSVTSIGYEAFSGCTSLPVIDGLRYADTYLVEVINKDITTCVINEGTRFIGSNGFTNCSSLTSVTIPNTVTNIGGEAFSGCSSLTSVTIPNTVTSIGGGAFSDCSSLKSVTIPNSVTSIENGAFSGCSGLTSVTIPNSVTSIENVAFSGCSSLKSVIIPNSVTRIGSYAFYDCSNLGDLTCLAKKVPEIGYSVFSNTKCSTGTLYVPAESIEAYKSADDWKDFGCILPLLEIIKGDVNNDEAVNVQDYVAVGNYILGNAPGGFNVTAADVNEDTEVNVQDYVGVANIILYDNPYGENGGTRAKGFNGTDEYYALSVTAKDNNAYSVSMNNSNAISAMQMEICLPENMNIEDIILSARASKRHNVTYRQTAPDTWKVLIASMHNDDFDGNEGEIMTFTTNANSAANITIDNILISDSQMVGHSAKAVSLSSEATGIEMFQQNIKNESLYDLMGRKVNVAKKQGIYVKKGKKIVF